MEGLMIKEVKVWKDIISRNFSLPTPSSILSLKVYCQRARVIVGGEVKHVQAAAQILSHPPPSPSLPLT